MTRLTLQQVLPEVAEVLNMNSTSARALRYLNRAQEELLNMGRWVGTTIKYRVRSSNGRITWPRELQTIEAMQINGAPAQLQNKWYEFLDYGVDFRSFYSRGDWSNGYTYPLALGTSVDQNEAISFEEICPGPNPKRLKVYGTVTEAAGARILLQFYDDGGNYVRTQDMAEGWVDGEFVTINSVSPQITNNTAASWVGVQKPVTNGVVRITELDTVTGLERLLAQYDPNETNPSYRRSLITGQLAQGTQQCPVCVTVIGSQRFIPAVSPRDYLCLTSKSAMINKAKAIWLMDNDNAQQSMIYDAKAFDLLNQELGKWTGAGDIQTPRFNPQNACTVGDPYFI